MLKIRLVVLAGTQYAKEISSFASRMNRVLVRSGLKVEIVKTTGPSIAKTLFSNNNTRDSVLDCNHCIVCDNNARSDTEGTIKSTVTGKSYKMNNSLTCINGGIYVWEGECTDQYSGKTTVEFNTRMHEHLIKQKSSSVYKHISNCAECNGIGDYKVSFIEDYRKRGKYTLSERESLWNYRIKGVINDQKTLVD